VDQQALKIPRRSADLIARDEAQRMSSPVAHFTDAHRHVLGKRSRTGTTSAALDARLMPKRAMVFADTPAGILAKSVKENGFVFTDAPTITNSDAVEMDSYRDMLTADGVAPSPFNDGRSGSNEMNIQRTWSLRLRSALFTPQFLAVVDAFFGDRSAWLALPPIFINVHRLAADQSWHRDLSIRRGLVLSHLFYTQPLGRQVTTLFARRKDVNIRHGVDLDADACSNECAATGVWYDNYHLHRGVRNTTKRKMQLLTVNFVKANISPTNWNRVLSDFVLPADLTLDDCLSAEQLLSD
jgi:hypothetical protein